MNRDVLKVILADQKEAYLSRPFIRREYSLEENVNYCFIGIRRTGKSYLMYQQMHDYLDSGVSMNQITYVNFEDERLLEMTAEYLNTILEIALEFAGPGKEPYLFLDEIQNVDGWEKFVRRLADMKYRVNITGSNSKMLSHEIASTLGGRFVILHVFPYSFLEFLAANGITETKDIGVTTKSRAEINRLYTDYCRFGAFPELVGIQAKRDYLNSVHQTIYLGDILARNKITNDFAIRFILKKVAESVMSPLSYSRLANTLKSAGVSIGKTTVINYVGYIIDSFLLFPIYNYSSKLADKEAMPKYYFMDNGILGLFLINGNSAQLENLVAIELIRRYGYSSVFYFERNVEIDFFIPEQNLAIQVCYSMLNDKETYDRETRALVRLKGFMPDAECIILTNSEDARIEVEGISMDIVPLWKWLLSGSHL